MARTKLSKCAFVEYGYGQVEPNHLSAQRTGQIYAQLPMGVDMLENGQFAKYNYGAEKVNFEGDSEWMLVYNAVKIYGDYDTEADYVMEKSAVTTGPIVGVSTDVVPRLFKTNVGDIFTTNTIIGETVTIGNKLVINEVAPNEDEPDLRGYLKVNNDATTGMIWQVVKVYTMPDGQRGVKIMRIA